MMWHHRAWMLICFNLLLSLVPVQAQVPGIQIVPGVPNPAGTFYQAILPVETFRPGDPLLAWCIAVTGPGSNPDSPSQEIHSSPGMPQPSPGASPTEDLPAFSPGKPRVADGSARISMYPPARARLVSSSGRVVGGDSAGRPLFLSPGIRQAYTVLLALPFDIEPGAYHLEFLDSFGTVVATATPGIADRTFIRETIPLDAANSALRRQPDPRKDAQWREIAAIYAQTDLSARYMTGSFGLPAGPVRRTAFFGDKRIYLYHDGDRETAIHAGIDFAMPVGTPVRAPAAGRIVLAKERIVTGNTLVIEHLPGMYSVLMHLSAFTVTQGQTVARGALVAKSGNTGLSTGPHLHWEVRVAGQPVDPEFFINVSSSPPGGAEERRR